MMAEAPEQIRAKNVFTQIKKRVPLMAQIKILNLLNDKELAFGEEIEVSPVFVPDEKKVSAKQRRVNRIVLLTRLWCKKIPCSQ